MRARLRVIAVGIFLVPIACIAPVAAAAHAQAVPTTAPAVAHGYRPDFNGDGVADLAIDAPNDDVGATGAAGSLWVLYGGGHGANTGNRHARLTEASAGVTPASNDNFGWVHASGDFNRDGYDDLAVGAPGRTIDVNGSPQTSAGEVVVLYGSPQGLGVHAWQVFTEATPGLAATPSLNDFFGLGLAAGDFNRDGATDLAVDAGGVSVGGVTRSGRVYELFGTTHGLSHTSPLLPRHLDEATAGIHGGLAQNDDWGRTLATGDFDGDGYADLAVGVPHKAVDGSGGAGVVDVVYGSATGLSTNRTQFWTEDTPGVPDSSQPADEWGWSLAVADFNGDRRSDLVIGAPTKTVNALSSAGAATLLLGSAHGLAVSGTQFYALSNVTNGQAPVAGDELAVSLAPLDFDGDGRVDLALGVPGRDVNSHSNAGEVVVLHNVGGRLSRSGGFALTRDTTGMIGPSANGERFGLLLAPGDYSGNGATDLAVALPGATVDTETHAGAMQVFYGSPIGFQTNDQLATASDLGGVAVQDAAFGGVNNPAGA